MPEPSDLQEQPATPVASPAEKTVFPILLAVSFCHLLNDTMQSLIIAIYPILKASFRLDFGQIGLISLTFQLTASILQPFVGIYTDRRPHPYSLVLGMGFSLVGLLLLGTAPTFGIILIAASLIGIGSSIFHPESSRVARLASGGKHGLAQSVFQVGGNAGSSLGPLLAAFIVVPRGQHSIVWFSIVALLGMAILSAVGSWYKAYSATHRVARKAVHQASPLPQKTVWLSMAVLIALMFSKFFYLASLSNYYTFYLIDKFHVSVSGSQSYLFLFLFSTAVGTIIGGPIGDRIGRRLVIWVSILGVLPFTLLLPHVNLFWTAFLTVPIGLILASAFSAIVVYAQDLLPGRVGLVSGIFFGLAFGLGGLGAAALGEVADHTSVNFVYQICAYLPIIGLLAVFLPDFKRGLGR